MKRLMSESGALLTLEKIRESHRAAIREKYEHAAEPCPTCKSPGECCLDAHFVNVRISRLEAIAIRKALDDLGSERSSAVYQKVGDVISRFKLEFDPPGDVKTFACPLYDRDKGCLVHSGPKPLPCIHHACYERSEDLPPDELLDEAELAVERLNERVYGRSLPLLPLPIAIKKVT